MLAVTGQLLSRLTAHVAASFSLSGRSEQFALVVFLVGLGVDPPEDIVSPRLRPPAKVCDLLCREAVLGERLVVVPFGAKISRAIVLTHVHPDHAGSASELAQGRAERASSSRM